MVYGTNGVGALPAETEFSRRNAVLNKQLRLKVFLHDQTTKKINYISTINDYLA